MKPNDLIEVTCLICNQTRAIKWSAYKRKKEKNTPPHLPQRCGSCSQRNKSLSQETKSKISSTLKGVPKTLEMREKLRQYRLDHPTENLIPGMGGGWNRGLKKEGEESESI
jgi:uncharacterized protein YlaI